MEIFTFNNRIVVRDASSNTIYIKKKDIPAWQRKYPCFSIKNFIIKQEDVNLNKVLEELKHYKDININGGTK